MRKTVNGFVCKFPFPFRDEQYYDCVELPGGQWCGIEEDDVLHQCEERGTSTEGSVPIQESVRLPVTEPVPEPPSGSNADCAFPFVYRQEVYNSCTVIGGKSQCKNSQDEWIPCTSESQSPTPQATVDGYNCSLPFQFRGTTYDACTKIAGVLQCKIAQDDDWHECVGVENSTVGIVKTVEGNTCSFPFIYRRIVYNQCVEIGQRFMCEAESGQLEECAQANGTSAGFEQALSIDARFTVDGLQCSFPFTYRGNVFQECIEIVGKLQCEVEEDDEWHECASQVVDGMVILIEG
eukprot:TRINITY_DN12166_c0_g1_i4.p1 TRINITY_DN12166_c0_g1~~TRINITY_DN12166_c0_g1_i4.p1  ORF type:complete len:293 (-),score=37.13 TRINITY_DN12166_c0_g1_i4:21-899(-)